MGLQVGDRRKSIHRQLLVSRWKVRTDHVNWGMHPKLCCTSCHLALRLQTLTASRAWHQGLPAQPCTLVSAGRTLLVCFKAQLCGLKSWIWLQGACFTFSTGGGPERHPVFVVCSVDILIVSGAFRFWVCRGAAPDHHSCSPWVELELLALSRCASRCLERRDEGVSASEAESFDG